MLSNTSQVDLDDIDEIKFPKVQDLQFVDCILEECEKLYISTKRWHYVRSLTTNFSVGFWKRIKIISNRWAAMDDFFVKYQLNGILADEMGLGKTIQIVSHSTSFGIQRCDWSPLDCCSRKFYQTGSLNSQHGVLGLVKTSQLFYVEIRLM
ncbi:uncharacterized protein LOC131638039 [Vicia villosa]|uniref:uncharacterized protein LOC131638039 n=1 Tax=Vicia villosa TaxID=3911 RepID=UPI00273C3DB6|nr:uncharacterized protein LOC131638039 [Vicia villosa]XP_058764583.1 uncharacterized protein LOC131638039 [Vicia villosa]